MTSSGSAISLTLSNAPLPPSPTHRTVGSQKATFFHLFWSHLAALPSREVGAYGPQWPVSDYVVRALSSPAGDDACGGKSGISGADKAATCAAFARAALNAASDATTGFPDEDSCPRWGQDTHQARFSHQVLGHSPLACLADREVEHGGDATTVNVGGKALFPETSGGSGAIIFQTEGPSYR